MDCVIRNGLIVDGTGAAPFAADVAIKDGRIVAVGEVAERGADEIDASGCIVTPGFVDIHTHYDGHATWTQRLQPSSFHGVTTVVFGNCGVGFAPCRPAGREALVRLMEGVEDIPDVVLNEGLPWNWETFPEYLDVLAQSKFDMDVAAYLPHAPLRVYVMGERALEREAATSDDIGKMREIARQAIDAGAMGFATSRSINHKASDGRITPSYTAAEEELRGIALGLADAKGGILQLISDFDEPQEEFAMLRRVAEASGRSLTFSLLQTIDAPDRWRTVLDAAEAAAKDGIKVSAQVCGRPIGLLAGLNLTTNPFNYCPTYKSLKSLPLAERLLAMRDPVVRGKIISEFPGNGWEPQVALMARFDLMYLMGSPPNYEPKPEESFEARAKVAGVDPVEYVYDLLTAGDGTEIIYLPAANFVTNDSSVIEAMIRSEISVPGLGDGGAHCKLICDASLPTYMLKRWVREDEGPLSLAGVVKALSADTADVVGLSDRGKIQVGLKADLNVIDLNRLDLHSPELVYDLPSGGGRLGQRAEGYVATMVAGAATYREGMATGALPGRLVRRQDVSVSVM